MFRVPPNQLPHRNIQKPSDKAYWEMVNLGELENHHVEEQWFIMINHLYLYILAMCHHLSIAILYSNRCTAFETQKRRSRKVIFWRPFHLTSFMQHPKWLHDWTLNHLKPKDDGDGKYMKIWNFEVDHSPVPEVENGRTKLEASFSNKKPNRGSRRSRHVGRWCKCSHPISNCRLPRDLGLRYSPVTSQVFPLGVPETHGFSPWNDYPAWSTNSLRTWKWPLK